MTTLPANGTDNAAGSQSGSITANISQSMSVLASGDSSVAQVGHWSDVDTTGGETGAINITAPPSGIMTVGGYRFLAQDLQEWSKRLGQGALLTALPDRLSGHRLAGRAQDNARAREALTELGLNPLMVEAFRDRSAPT